LHETKNFGGAEPGFEETKRELHETKLELIEA
jgi:hypothetical protein